MERTDVVVVGAGIVGALVAAEVAGRGRGVQLLERDVGPGAAGSSKGSARFRQLADHPDDSFLEMGVRARRLWEAIEDTSPEPIFHRTGNLSIGSAERLAQLASSLRRFDLPCEEVAGREVPSRWPCLRGRSGDVLFQPDGEVIAADVAHRAVLSLAERRGVAVHRGRGVTGIEPMAPGVRVHDSSGAILANRAVVAAGSWVAGLVRELGIDLPVRVTRQSVGYWAMAGPAPPTITDWGGDEPFLLWDPILGLKAAEHARGPEVDPDEPGNPDPDVLGRVQGFLTGVLAAEPGRPYWVETCLYTNAPEDRFIVERVGDVVVVSACSGHGFQFAPLVAELVADAISS